MRRLGLAGLAIVLTRAPPAPPALPRSPEPFCSPARPAQACRALPRLSAHARKTTVAMLVTNLGVDTRGASRRWGFSVDTSPRRPPRRLGRVLRGRIAVAELGPLVRVFSGTG